MAVGPSMNEKTGRTGANKPGLLTLTIKDKSALYLAGAEVDYLDGLMQSGFKITNPNAKTTCGCGQSFH